jgi:hypothetical protein
VFSPQRLQELIALPNGLITQLFALNQLNTFYPHQNRNKIWIISLKRMLSAQILCIKRNTGAYLVNLYDNGLYQYFRTIFPTAWLI